MDEQHVAQADRESLVVRPVGQRSAVSQVVSQLRTAIADGTLRTGDRLPSEHQLATDFGVSRGTVREAIRHLAASNLVYSTRGALGGTFVRTPTADEVAADVGGFVAMWFRAGNVSLSEVQHARHVLEHECVQLAALHRTEDDLAAIRQPVETSRDPDLDDDAWLATDVDFHTAISRSAKNSILELAMTAVHLVRPKTNRLIVQVLDRTRIADQHWAIYTAIRDRDPAAAQAAFEAHVEYLDDAQRRTRSSAEDPRVLDLPGGLARGENLFGTTPYADGSETS